MNGFLVNIALGLVVSEISSAAGSVDWPGLKATVNTKIKAVVTNTQIEPTVEGLVDAVIDVAEQAVNDTADLKDLVSQAVAKNWNGALLDLKSLMNKAISGAPQSPATAEIAAILAA